MNINIILITLLSIIILLCIRNIAKQNKEINKIKEIKEEELKNLFKESWDKEERDFNLKKIELQIKEKEIENKVVQLNISLEEKQKRYNEVNQDLDLYKKEKIKEIDNTGAEYKQRRQLIIDNSINEYRAQQICRANTELIQLEDQKEDILNKIQIIKNELEEERRKRAAVNEEIRRAREVEEQQEFYKIQIDSNDLEDINLLRSITSRLRHPEAINKVIWSGYYQKPLAELRKRAGISGSGIYKITRLKTGEIYIGQAVNVSTRWAEHCKTALGVGTLASSQLHRTMAEDGPEKFTFEVIEEVEKNKLRERESYYIDFYDSKNYGLNTLRGNQNK